MRMVGVDVGGTFTDAVVYDDAAYGAEVHHFTDGQPLDTVTFPDTDIAAIGAGYGYARVVASDDAQAPEV